MDNAPIAQAESCGDFWAMLEEALKQSGGNPQDVFCDGLLTKSLAKLSGKPPSPLATLPLQEVVSRLATKGFRMVYLPEKRSPNRLP